MRDIVKKHLNKLNKREEKILNKKKGFIDNKLEPLVDKAESYVPEGLRDTLDKAFYNAFKLIFEKGTKVIEKSYNKRRIQANHNFHDFSFRKSKNNKTLKKIDKHAQRSNFINRSISTIEGAGLGLLGMGLPDIPLFTALILKTIYEISLSYGYLYELEDERLYILSIVNAALTTGEEQKKYNFRVDAISHNIDNNFSMKYDMEKEIQRTSQILSDSMLASKFVQGIPLVAAVGSIANYRIINKISKYASIKYKKRYLSK
ncbi:MAG: EcsC family protein [Bacillota bacterium]|nr:EcsC family protein [Bacillota bacterium]NLL60464.1 EcsC family protein [Tissierellia bacterium]